MPQRRRRGSRAEKGDDQGGTQIDTRRESGSRQAIQRRIEDERTKGGRSRKATSGGWMKEWAPKKCKTTARKKG